jgi:hypothetical protein
MYSANAPLEQHVLNEIRLAQNKSKPNNVLNTPRILLTPPRPTLRKRFLSFFHKTLIHRGLHVHNWTCKKGKAGLHRCRSAYPTGSNEFTRLIELELQGDPKGLRTVLEVEPKSPPRELYLKVDGRVIVWEIMRPLLNKLPEPNMPLSEVENTDYAPGSVTDNYDHKAAILHSFLSSQL